jgi:hypothetical protein
MTTSPRQPHHTLQHIRKLLLGILFLATHFAPAQTVSVPTSSELDKRTKELRADFQRGLDSLATVLRAEFDKPVPPVPKPDECEHGVQLVEVYDVSPTGLWYNFYSQGVVNMRETIRNNSGRVVLDHVTTGLTRDRIYLPYSLEPGSYSLQIENADCDAKSQIVPFTIQGGGGGGQPDPVEPDPDPQPTGFLNAGVYSIAQNGKLYEWIPSEGIDVEIRNGKVKIIAPETKRSFDGSTECRRFLISDLYDNILPEAEERALFGEGLELPFGNYQFKIIYTAAGSWNELLKNKWYYIGTDGNGQKRAAKGEVLIISVSDQAELDRSTWANQFRASWVPQYFILDQGLKLPDDKIFGPTRYIATLPHDNIFRNATHIQNPGGVFNYTSPDKWWFNLQARPGTRQPDQVIREAPVSRRFVAFAELTENYGNDENDCPNCYYKAESVFKGLYERYQRELGVKSPYETWLITDYFSPMYAGSLDVDFRGASREELIRGLSDLSHARSFRSNLRWYQSDYFKRGWYDYRNFMSHGYLGNILSQLGDPIYHDRLYHHEKTALAIPDRKRVTYITPQQEWLGIDYLAASGTSYRHPLNGGEIIRDDAFVHSFETFKVESFFSMLFGNGTVIWDSNIGLNPDPATFGTSWWGGDDDWKTRWRKDGKTEVYNPNNPNHPPHINAKGQFPERPSVAEQGAYVGAKLYEQFGFVHEVVWADYERNGIKVVANRGQDGTARANVAGVQNFGQANAALVLEEKLPVCLIVKAQHGRFLVFQDPFAGLTGSQLITVEGKNYLIKGNRLEVRKIE